MPRQTADAKANRFLGRNKDVLLRCVAEDLESLIKNLEASIELGTQQLTPRTEELLRLRWRSEDMLKDFGGYFCVRLVLDDESPLALQMMDFFCELNWLTEGFEEEVRSVQDACSITLESSKANVLQTVVDSSKHLLESLQTVVETSRVVHWFYRMSRIKNKEFKRMARSHRMFSKNVLESHIQQRGFVNLDRSSTKVELDDEPLAEGGFGSVYKGHFIIRRSGDPNSSSERVSDPVAVKMMRSAKLHNCCSSILQNLNFGNVTESDQEIILEESGNISYESGPESEEAKSGNISYESDPESAEANSANNSYSEHCMSAKTSNASLVVGSPNFLSEVLKLASFRHPNIVDVRGYIEGRKEYDFGIVMEFMDMSLRDALNKWQLRELDMIDLMLEIAKGMRFLHERNALHLDLKPGNVLLRRKKRGVLEYFEVKLGDLGFTRFMYGGVDSESCEEGLAARNVSAFLGTSYYTAPELRTEEGSEATKCTDKADVFSYGSTCFNILTCNPDMRSSTGSNVECFYNAIKSRTWRQWVKGCPIRLVNLLERCWQMQASERPTFAEICLVLQCEKRLVLTGKREDQLFCLPALLREACGFQLGSSSPVSDKTWPAAGLSLDKSTWLRQERSSPKQSYRVLLNKIGRGLRSIKLLMLSERSFHYLLRDEETELLQHRKVLMDCSDELERAFNELRFFISGRGRLILLWNYLCSLPTNGTGQEHRGIARRVWRTRNWWRGEKFEEKRLAEVPDDLLEEMNILVVERLLTPSVYSQAQRMTAFLRAMYEEAWSTLCHRWVHLAFQLLSVNSQLLKMSFQLSSSMSFGLAKRILLTQAVVIQKAIKLAATQKIRKRVTTQKDREPIRKITAEDTAGRLLTCVEASQLFQMDDAKTPLRVDESVLPLLLGFNLCE